MIAVRKILVPTDFDLAADAALDYARELAVRFDAAVHVLHVADNVYLRTFGAESAAVMAPQLQAEIEEAARKRLDDLVAARGASNRPLTTSLATSAAPAFAIVEYAKEHAVDLIVMGTHGRGPLGHLVLGNVAERVVRLAPCPVLTLRNPNHKVLGTVAAEAAVHA
jgi:nucleotide-binding universal stress UspA family protein